MEEKLIEVHLKRKILWWDGDKPCNVRKFSGTLKTIHLEVIDGQGCVVAPFKILNEYGCFSSGGLLFPIKESVEFVEEIKHRQSLLPKSKKEKLLDEFMEDYNDFISSDDKMHWVPKKIREMLQKHKE